MNGRVYDPNLGRFLSVDPVFEFPTNTQSLNPYSYVLNNPLSLTDPTGYEAQACPDETACTTGMKPGEKITYTQGNMTVTATKLANGNYALQGNNAQATKAINNMFGNGGSSSQGAGDVMRGTGEDATSQNTTTKVATLNNRTGGDSNNKAGSNTVPVNNKAISRGDNAILNDRQIGNIIFNESSSLSGKDIDQARQTIAGTIINGDEEYGINRPDTASTVLDEKKLNSAQMKILTAIRADVAKVRADRANGVDLAHGATLFSFRDLNKYTISGAFGMLTRSRESTGGDMPIRTSAVGPFKNSYPSPDLGPNNIYLLLFKKP